MMLDELVDLDEETLIALDVLTKQKERVASDYNKNVPKGAQIVRRNSEVKREIVLLL